MSNTKLKENSNDNFLVHFVKKYICNTKMGDYFVNAIRIREWDGLIYYFKDIKTYKKECAHPTKEMIETQKFFKDNKDRIKQNISYLSDDESKKIYLQAIKYRGTHNIKKAPSYNKERYFVSDIIHLGKEEVFVDAGAFVGDTVREIKKRTKGQYKKIICFEPDEYNFKMLSIQQKKIHNLYCEKLGLWKENTTLSFFNNGSVGSKIINDNSENCINESKINVVALDNCAECRDATYIKMDIEGAEYNAILGAETIIKTNHPQLAICIYHSNEDMINIIELIHEKFPEYKMFVRHHSKYAVEDVLYCKL